MKQLFSNSRIKLKQMMEDVATFTKDVYNQSGNLYTAASPWGQVIMVLTRLGQMILYFIEDSITELNINTASRPHSLYGLSRLTGHNPTRAIAAMGDIFLIHNGNYPDMYGQNVIIPNFTSIKCKDNNLNYLVVLTQDEIKINIYQEKRRQFLKLIQGTLESQQFTGTGYPLQSYECNMPEGKYIDHFFVNVFVNGEKWQKYESLYDIPLNGKGVLVKTGITSGIDVYFGTNSFGLPPPLGSTIVVEYLITEGFIGNINDSAGVVFEFQDSGYDDQGNEIDLNKIFNVGIATPITFGSAPETTYLTRLLAPGTSRSFVLANTGNYISFFEKFQQFSYIDAYTEYNIWDPYVDNIVYVLLVPDITKRIAAGQNYFTVDLEKFKLTDLEKYKIQVLLEESGRKILGAIVNFIDPQFKRYAVNVYLNTWKGFNKDYIREDIISKFSDYFSTFNRKDFMPKSDLIALLEGVAGVDSVNLEFISEDIEYELSLLLNPSTIFSSGVLSDADMVEIYDSMVAKATNGNLNTLSLEDKLSIIFGNSGVRKFIAKHIDDNGDIVLNQNEIPLIRGGWVDRYGKSYTDTLDSTKLGSVNIYFLRENERDNKINFNNINVNTLK